ncbi:helix-turn-helix domain-containing protein [Streptomyces sp. NPDC059373]
MTHEDEPVGPTRAIAKRVKELRGERGLTGANLAERMTELGVPWDRSIVANLENGRRGSVSVAELLGLAFVLDVAPIHLLVPAWPSPLWDEEGHSRPEGEPNEPNDDAPYQITPTLAVPCWRARQFVRGSRPLPGMDAWKFYAEQPAHERPDAEGLRKMVESNQRYAGGA